MPAWLSKGDLSLPFMGSNAASAVELLKPKTCELPGAPKKDCKK
jgi:hypothetical protein